MSGLMPTSKLYCWCSSSRTRTTRPRQILAIEGFDLDSGFDAAITFLLDPMQLVNIAVNAKPADGYRYLLQVRLSMSSGSLLFS